MMLKIVLLVILMCFIAAGAHFRGSSAMAEPTGS
jgi:hypothetical protein